MGGGVQPGPHHDLARLDELVAREVVQVDTPVIQAQVRRGSKVNWCLVEASRGIQF